MNASLRGTGNSHGVRQRPPLDGRASAPGGLDWIVNVAVEGGSNKSMFGTFKFGRFEFTPDEQFVSPRPHIAPTIARQIFTPDPCRSSYLIERRETQDRAQRVNPIPDFISLDSGYFLVRPDEVKLNLAR